MTCYSPNHCYDGGLKANGRVNVLWKAPPGTKRVEIPCGKCVGCKLDYSAGMAMRCMLEADCYDLNSFVTLTFDDKKLPPGFDGNLNILDHQLFMKRLRKCVGNGVRFYMAGEYGGEYGRPHYHYLLFNCGFNDKVFLREMNGNRLYTSGTLERLWPFGYSSIGDVTYESAAYVARYCLKKVNVNVGFFKDFETGTRMQFDKLSGEVKVAEFTQMSRGGRVGYGIGEPWFRKYGLVDVFPSDEVVVNGNARKPPRFFDKLLERVNPQLFDEIKAKRLEYTRDWNESTDLRLRVKEQVKLAQIRTLKRELTF